MKTDIRLARKYLENLSDKLEKLIPTIEDMLIISMVVSFYFATQAEKKA